MNGTDVKGAMSGLATIGTGLLSWGMSFITKYANTLLLIGLVVAVSKVTSGNSLKAKI